MFENDFQFDLIDDPYIFGLMVCIIYGNEICQLNKLVFPAFLAI